MPTSNLQTWFETMAQVSISATGLLTIAVALDSDIRAYWFDDPAHRLIAVGILLEMLLPAFVSISGLIPPINFRFPTWPISTVLLSLIYLFVSVYIHTASNDLENQTTYTDHWKNLTRNLVNEMCVSGLLLLLASIFGFRGYTDIEISTIVYAETAVGTILTLSLFVTITTSVTLLRSQRDMTKSSKPTTRSAQQLATTQLNKQKHRSPPTFGLIGLLVSGLTLGLILGLLYPSSKPEK